MQAKEKGLAMDSRSGPAGAALGSPAAPWGGEIPFEENQVSRFVFKSGFD